MISFLSSQRTVQETKGWDVFRDPPIKLDSGSMANQKCMNLSVKILKVVAYILTFVIVLTGGVVSKGCVLFMTSHVKRDRKITYCNKDIAREKQFVTTLPDEERVVWMWAILMVFAIPEVGALIRSVRICFFKSWKRPKTLHFLFVTLMETLHTLGLALLMFVVLPELDAVKGAMLTNCLCVIPGFLGLLSRTKKEGRRAVKSLVDIAAIAAQITGFVVWPLLENRPVLWVIPVAALATSCGWWENYVSTQSPFGFVRSLGRIKDDLRYTRYFTYIFMSIWKVMLFFFSILVILWFNGEDPGIFFSLFGVGMGPHKIIVEEVTNLNQILPDLQNVQNGDTIDVDAAYNTVIYVLIIQVLAAYVCYIFGKFACKIMIQGFSYAFPVNLTIPVSISMLIAACGIRNGDPCFFHGTIPDYLFFDSPPVFRLSDFASRQMAWAWLLWLLSQTWITLHIWTPKCERLATTEKLFVNPMYNALLIDQSMALNRRRDDQADVKTEVSDFSVTIRMSFDQNKLHPHVNTA